MIRNRISRSFVVSVLLMAFSTFPALAQELYDPAPPANAAFVRFIQAIPNVRVARVSVDGNELASGFAYLVTSPYAIVGKGTRRVAVEIGKGQRVEQTIDVKSGYFYSLALVKNSKLLVLEDTASSNLAKAQISLYNLAEDVTVELKTGDGKVTVIPPLASMSVRAVQVNPIRVDFSVLANGDKIDTFPAIQLQAASGYSAIVGGAPGKLKSRWVVSTTARVAR